MKLSLTVVHGSDVVAIRNASTGQVIAVATVSPQHFADIQTSINRNNAFEVAPRSARERMVQA